MSSIEFEYPFVLFALPLLLWCLKRCPQKEDSVLFSNTTFIKQSKKTYSLLELFKLLSIIFVIISLAYPYQLQIYQKKDDFTRSTLLTIDISGSMQENFKDVKNILQNHIKNSQGVLFGTLFFADDVAISSLPSSDKNFLTKAIKIVHVGDLGEMDTKLYDALTVSITLLKNSKSKHKNILLLTDGKDKGSKTTLQKLLSMVDKTIQINIIGFGELYDQDTLKTISKLSNGKFYKAKDINQLKKLISKLSKKNQTKSSTYTVKKPLYQIPLFLAFLSILFFTYLSNKRAVV